MTERQPIYCVGNVYYVRFPRRDLKIECGPPPYLEARNIFLLTRKRDDRPDR